MNILDSKEIKPVNPKGNQLWIFIGRTDAVAEAPILWPPDVKSQLIGEDPDAGKDWRQEKNGTTEDEMVGRHHRLNGHEFEQTPEDCEGQGNLACCGSFMLVHMAEFHSSFMAEEYSIVYICTTSSLFIHLLMDT